MFALVTGVQTCALPISYCGSDRALPEALFQSTNRNFFSCYNGNIMHDWIIYDPRELVNLVDQYAAEDGITFDPAVRSASASSVINESVRAAYLMASLDTEIGGMPLAINAGLRYEDTDYTSSGESTTVISAKPPRAENGDPTGKHNIVVDGQS